RRFKKARGYLARMNRPTNPITLATAPPIISHMALSVGEPVKVRETSELNEWFAWSPKNKRIIPPASRATEIALFISQPPVYLTMQPLYPWFRHGKQEGEIS